MTSNGSTARSPMADHGKAVPQPRRRRLREPCVRQACVVSELPGSSRGVAGCSILRHRALRRRLLGEVAAQLDRRRLAVALKRFDLRLRHAGLTALAVREALELEQALLGLIAPAVLVAALVDDATKRIGRLRRMLLR